MTPSVLLDVFLGEGPLESRKEIDGPICRFEKKVSCDFAKLWNQCPLPIQLKNNSGGIPIYGIQYQRNSVEFLEKP